MSDVDADDIDECAILDARSRRRRRSASAEKTAAGESAGENSGSTRASIIAAGANVAAEWVPTGDLQPWARNPRKNKAAIRAVADSIRRFGFASPIVARRESREIIAGHTRWEAAKLLKLASVPVRFLDISERDAHLLALADNKTGEISEWDNGEVAKILSDYNFGDAMIAGWSGSDLGKMAAEIVGAPDGADQGRERLGGALTYSVIVECEDEFQQGELLSRLEGEGLKCKPLVT